MLRAFQLMVVCGPFLIAATGCGWPGAADPTVFGARVDELHIRAETLFDEQDFAGALAMNDQIIALDPDDAWAYIGRGDALTLLGRHDEAIHSFDRALALDGELADAYVSRGWAFEWKEQWAKALDDYRAALRLDGKRSDALCGLAWVLATCPRDELRNGQEAITAAKQALRLATDDDPIALDALATGYAEIGEFKRAVDCARQALQIVRGNTEPLDDELGPRIEARIEQYERGEPHRDVSPDSRQ